jgi:ABC-type transporter Mla maintaining outer membrane lipid asymmetry ATPase subunit MlaF
MTVVLSARGVCMVYRRRTMLDKVSFEVRRGEAGAGVGSVARTASTQLNQGGSTPTTSPVRTLPQPNERPYRRSQRS